MEGKDLVATCTETARELASANVRLAYKLAMDAHLRNSNIHVGIHGDIDELRGEALLALTIAATRFDESLGVKFSTFAFSYIQGILRNKTDRFLGFTSEAQYALIQGRRLADSTYVSTGVKMTMGEIDAKFPGYTLAESLKALARTTSPEERSERTGARFEFEDARTDVEEAALSKLLDPALETALGKLSPTQERLVREHILEGKSIEELSKSFGASSQYMYQQRKSAFNRLRSILRRDSVIGEISVSTQAPASHTPTLAPIRKQWAAA